MGDDRTLHVILRELRAVTIALADHHDNAGPGDTAAGLARIRALAGQGLRRLGRDPEADEFDAHLDRIAEAAHGVRAELRETGTAPIDTRRPGPAPGTEPGARARPDLGSGAPLEHEHSWPNRYTSCTCGAPPPTDYGAPGPNQLNPWRNPQ
jgi:hypothetical protein